MLKEFKAFLMRGNVVDLAVAVVIGAAFTAIVNSLVADIITPAILNPAIEAAGVKNLEELAWGALKYGKFLAAIINFIIIGFVLFMLVKGMNRLQTIKKQEEEEAPAAEPVPTKEEVLLTEIRDLLKDKPQI
ncbi:MAG: large conductance mechanosensitive channel protein MscL [Flavobacteriia bacterium]|nr:large conductance mechanosensitive channel protein MscL [Flavobacteriia bacterium]OJX37074.1 MAG: large-conductance mechanosensitive channel [Flavobacteriia bacterium 40-80]